jgi:D-galactose 1-dehydrogenase
LRRWKIGVVGLGVIAKGEHLPAISGNAALELAAVASHHPPEGFSGAPVFSNMDEMLRGVPDLDAVAICTPPAPRYAMAREALLAGRHVLLEKPPTLSLAQGADLRRLAQERDLTLFASWHSRFNAAVGEAARRLATDPAVGMAIEWREDVREFHPGQEWIWAPGGFGVFDPGINALAIATAIFPGPLFIEEANLAFPSNRQTPIAADLTFTSPDARGSLRARFDWRGEGEPKWDIALTTQSGRAFLLSGGGARLEIDGRLVVDEPRREYPALYAHFVQLLESKRSDADLEPLGLVADAFMLGRRTEVAAFVTQAG